MNRLRIACASSVCASLRSLAYSTGQAVDLIPDASGRHAARILQGAPFDLFFSADVRFPQKIARDAELVHGSVHVFAYGRLAFWNRQPADPVAVPAADRGGPRKQLRQHLERAGRIAIADTRLAPYGRAAMEVMQRLGVNSRGRLVVGLSVQQVNRYIDRQATDAAFTAWSSLGSKQRAGRSQHYLKVDASLHDPLAKGAVVLRSRGPGAAERRAAAERFVQLVLSPAGGRRLQEFGLERPR